MKMKLLTYAFLMSVTACQHSAKDPDAAVISVPESATDKIEREIITDRFGDEIEIITNTTKNRITVRLGGKTYELEKNKETSGFSTADYQYQLTETKSEVTFLKKDIDMVLFHSKKDQASTKMASQ